MKIDQIFKIKYIRSEQCSDCSCNVTRLTQYTWQLIVEENKKIFWQKIGRKVCFSIQMSDLKRSDHFHVNFKTNITKKILSTPFSYGTWSQVETYLTFIIGLRANQYLIFRFLSLLKRALYLKVCYVLLDSVPKAFFWPQVTSLTQIPRYVWEIFPYWLALFPRKNIFQHRTKISVLCFKDIRHKQITCS